MKYLRVPLFLTLLSVHSFGCSCMPPPPAVEKAAKATAAFTARIKSESLEGHTRTYEVEVLEVFSGKEAGVVRVSTAKDGATCGVQFSTGKEYLIFCYGEPQSLRTGLCSGNLPADSEKGKKEIEELKKVKK